MGRPGTSASPETSSSGERIRHLRAQHGLTQQQVADEVNVSRQTIVAMETSAYAPSVHLALKVAAVLGSTVEKIWGDADSTR